MEIGTLTIKLILAFALGAVMGLEREVNEKRQKNLTDIPTALFGLRSFSLISLLGVIVGYLYPYFPGLALITGGVYFLLLLIAYTLDSLQSKDAGITTELGMIFSFIIGVLLSIEAFPTQLTLAIAIVVILMLSQKQKIKHVVTTIKQQEVNAFISFAIIALVIFPFLPNTSYAAIDIPGAKLFFEQMGLGDAKLLAIDLINPFKLWLIVVLVIGVDLVGYVLERTVGRKKGWLLASAAGGFVSSTATTQSLAQESKHRHNVNPLIAAAILANIVSFVQIAFLIGFINSFFLLKLLPVIGFMIVTGVGLLLYFLLITDKHTATVQEEQKNEEEKIIDIGAAVKFALFFLLISIISQIALQFFGSNGFFIATGIGALLGLDAVMINTAELAESTITLQTAVLAFILANFVNLAGKSFYSFFLGKREFAIKFVCSMLCIIASSLLGMLFL